MKTKKKFPVEFYINPSREYKNHGIDVLKECLIEWDNAENMKFMPRWENFKYERENMEIREGVLIPIFHCYADWKWVKEHKLLDETLHLNELLAK